MRTVLIRLSTLLTALTLVLPLTLPSPAKAQVDLGNDGIDWDCADFPELNAAQAYFDTDGGSAGRNVDQLDPTGDGRACEAADQAAEDTGDGTATDDADSDGLTDEEELERGTDPNVVDSDNDRLSDGFEAREFGTDPLAADSDEDGLGDGDELEVYQTDPLRVDTDGDGVDDATELDAGTDPRVPDGGTVTLDADQDGLVDEEELELGTDPDDADSDNDRLSDGFEARELGTDPLAADSDEDSLGDGDELEVYRTDPLRADTDGDGDDDATELDAGTDPRVPESGGNPTPVPTATAAAAQPTHTPVSIQPISTSTPTQQDTPEVVDTLTAELRDVNGTTVAVALLAEGIGEDGEVSVGAVALRMTPGSHGMHLYEMGRCDPEGSEVFASAGEHYNPTGAEHGRHAGDLGNITAGDDGTATFLEQTDAFDLADLLDEDGTAIVIHADEDENDPAGESFGARIACGVLAVPAR